LQAVTGSVSIGKLLPHSIQNAIPVANPLSDDQRFRIIENFADLLSARNFSGASSPGVVCYQNYIAREERRVRPTEIEQHAVIARDRNDPHARDPGRIDIG
jgi:hypothetical protein